jgi:tripartite-type tricarboxylate transporter receptor subunit TctC
LVHVPYRGAAPAVQDVAGGQLPFMFVDTASGMASSMPASLRAIGIASPQRVKNFETIPTLDEQGLKGFEAYAWQGLAAPAGTPDAVVAKLNKTLVDALNSTPVKARFQVLGLEPTPSTPAQMASYAKAEREKWAQVIRASGIKLD